jgi:hypothetical protein
MHFGVMGGANAVDFGTQDWYTRPRRACKKCLILLGLCDRRGNPSLSANRKNKYLKLMDFFE